MNYKPCKNCGAGEGLHHYQTMQCPVGGIEAPIGYRQEWMDCTYEERDPLRDAAPELLDALEGMLIMFEKVSDKIGASFLNAEAIRLMNEKPIEARAAIAKAKGES